MSKHAKLSALLSAAFFLILIVMFVAGFFDSWPNEYGGFWVSLIVGIALINLAVWGQKWLSSSAD